MTQTLAESIQQFHMQSGAAPIDKTCLTWLLSQWTQLPLQQRKTLSNEALKEAKGLISRHFARRNEHQIALDATLAYLSHVLGWTIPTKDQQTLQQKEQQRFQSLGKQGHLVDILQNALLPILKRDTTSNTLDIGVTALYLLTHMAPLPLHHLVTILDERDAVKILDDGRPIVYFELGCKLANGTPHAASYGINLISWQRLKRHHQQGGKTSETALLAAINRTLSAAPLYFDILSKRGLTVLIQAYWKIVHRFDMPTLQDWSHPELSAAIPSERLLKPALQTPSTNKASTHIYRPPTVNKSASVNPKEWPHKALIRSLRKGEITGVDGDIDLSSPDINASNVLPYVVFEQTKALILYGGKNRDSLATASIALYTSLDALLEANPLALADCADEEAIAAWAQQITNLAGNDSQRIHLRYLLSFMASFELTEELQLDHIETSAIALSINPNRLSPLEFGKTIESLFKTQSDSGLTTLFSVAGAILGYYGALRSGEVIRLRMRDINQAPYSKTIFKLTICNTAEGKTKNRRRRDVYLSLPEICAYWLRLLIWIKHGDDGNHPLIGFATESISTRKLRYLAPVSRALQSITQSNVRFHHLRHSGAQLLSEQVHLLRDSSRTPSAGTPYDTATYDHAYNRFSEHHQGERIEHLTEGALFALVGKMLGHSHQATTRKSYLHGHERMRDFLLPEKTVFEKWELRFILGLAPNSNDLSRHLQKLNLDYDLGDRQLRKNQAVPIEPQTLFAYALRKHWQGTKPTETLLSIEALNRLWLISLTQQTQSRLVDFLLLQMYRTQRKPASNNAAAMPITWELINAAFNTAGRHKALVLTKKQRRTLAEALRQFTLTHQKAKGVVLKRWLNADSAAINLVATLTRNKTFGLLLAEVTLYTSRKTLSSTLFTRLKKEVRAPHQLLEPCTLKQGKSQIAIELSSAHFPITELVSLYCEFLSQ